MKKLRRFFLGRLFPCAISYMFLLALTVGLAVYLPSALAPLAAFERLLALIAAVLVSLDRTDTEIKLGKLVLIVLLPYSGAIVCLLLRRQPQAPHFAPARGIFSDELCDRLGAVVSAQCGIAPCFAKEAKYYPTGADFFSALIKSIGNAKKFIWLEYYIVANGTFWGATLSALTERAECGVDVRLVYDDFGCALTLPKNYPQKLKKYKIKAHPVRRLTPFSPARSNVRDHRKCAIIDGETVFLGGINLADEYIGELIKYGNWKDTAISLTGAPARAFAIEYAKHQINYDPSNGKSVGETANRIALQNGGIPCIPVLDRAYAAGVSYLANAAQKTLYFSTPYLAPDKNTLFALQTAAKSGIDVRIIIPHIPDKKSIFLLTRRAARELMRYGVQVREYTAGFVHAKSLTVDGKLCAVTSHNLDYRSLRLQRECGAFVFSADLTKEIERDFLNMWESGTPVPVAKRAEKAASAILSLFTPIL